MKKYLLGGVCGSLSAMGTSVVLYVFGTEIVAILLLFMPVAFTVGSVLGYTSVDRKKRRCASCSKVYITLDEDYWYSRYHRAS